MAYAPSSMEAPPVLVRMDGVVHDVIAIPSTRAPDMVPATPTTAPACVTPVLLHRQRMNPASVSFKADGVNSVPITGFPKASARVSATRTPRMTGLYTCSHTIIPGLGAGDTAHARGMGNRSDVNARPIQTPTSTVPNVSPPIIPNIIGSKTFPTTPIV